MSKEAALRAMREARFNARSAASAPAATPARRTTSRPAKAEVTETAAPKSPSEELCGHRSMNGRTCTREAGHSAKSHRYS